MNNSTKKFQKMLGFLKLPAVFWFFFNAIMPFVENGAKRVILCDQKVV